MLGPHLMLDCYGCDENKLKDLDFVLKFLDELPTMISMHKIADPYAIYYPGKSDSFDKGGISAIVIIAESHISIHTFPANNYMSVDIFSCKIFDIEKAIEYITKAFGAKKFEKKILNRGLEFPKDVPKAMKIVKKQREKINLE
jgi:S-adenosylmethionine decarboxylase